MIRPPPSGVTLDLSGWTFQAWDEGRNQVYIATNSAQKVLNDVVVGTKVADQIYTYYGDDTIRGGGGADVLNGGAGNDTFAYGLNEAAAGEYVNGGNGPQEGTADVVVILGDNDFTGVSFVGIDKFVFGAAAKAIFDQSFVNGSRLCGRGHGPGGEPGDRRRCRGQYGRIPARQGRQRKPEHRRLVRRLQFVDRRS